MDYIPDYTPCCTCISVSQPPNRLLRATMRGRVAAVKKLLSLGAEAVKNSRGWRPLDEAAASGSFPLTKLLLENAQ
eukprot:7383101-Pyramimonas_sp.AAC.1